MGNDTLFHYYTLWSKCLSGVPCLPLPPSPFHPYAGLLPALGLGRRRRCGKGGPPWFLYLGLALGKTCGKAGSWGYSLTLRTLLRSEHTCVHDQRTGKADAGREGFVEEGGFELGSMAGQDLQKE